jgi:protease PrsW
MRRRRPWIIAGLVLLVAAVAGPLSILAIGLGTTMAGLIVGMLMAAVPVPFYVAFSTWVDRFEPEPPWLLAFAFLWGSTIAVFFSILLNGIAGELFASHLVAIATAPVVEETAKAGALVLLFVWRRDEFDNVTDGIIYAAMVGLGFAMTENIQYYSTAVAADGGKGAAIVFVLRGIMSPFSHPLYTSMTGIGLGIARESDRRNVKLIAPVAGLVGAILLHSLWNLSASLGLVFFAAYFFVMAPALAGVVVVAVFSLRREARIIRSHLESVVAERVLTAEDVAVVTSVQRRIAASGQALMRNGFRQWRARRRFHALVTELAFHAWRARRFHDPDSESTRMALLNAVRATRSQLGLPPVTG